VTLGKGGQRKEGVVSFLLGRGRKGEGELVADSAKRGLLFSGTKEGKKKRKNGRFLVHADGKGEKNFLLS